jgi:hypothetical protein
MAKMGKIIRAPTQCGTVCCIIDESQKNMNNPRVIATNTDIEMRTDVLTPDLCGEDSLLTTPAISVCPADLSK